MDPINTVWSEKYRPKKVSLMVGDFKEKILKYLEDPVSIPHFLLYSKTPGTGKTTLAKAIINELGCDALVLNSSDDRKIDTVREKVKEFSITQSSKTGLKRCVFMDEFDGMLKASQEALRNVMETYSKNVFFILTCNSVNRVIEPIKNRCVVIGFSYPKKEEIYVYLENICKVENLNYTEAGIKLLIDKNYPSIRKSVLKLQDLYTERKDVTEQTVEESNDLFTNMWKHIQDKNWMEVKRIVMSSELDPRELNTFFWQKSLDENNQKLIQLTCRNEKDFAQGADPKIIMVTSLIEMVK